MYLRFSVPSTDVTVIVGFRYPFLPFAEMMNYRKMLPGIYTAMGTNKAFRRYLQTDAEKVKNLYRKARGAEVIKFEPAKKVPKDFGTS